MLARLLSTRAEGMIYLYSTAQPCWLGASGGPARDESSGPPYEVLQLR